VSRPQLRWSELHHGIDPDGVPLLGAWLRWMWAMARPLARRGMHPTVLTAAGALLAVGAVVAARPWPWVALGLVLASVVCDGLDGAVAVLSDRATRSGARADAVADRVADASFAAILWRTGAPWWLALAAGTVGLAHEGFRALRGGARLGRLTVSERPTRTICAAIACVCAGVSSAAWPPTVCAAVLLTLAVVGLAQLAPS